MIQENNTRNLLSIHDLCRQGTRALGPGVRYVIWTQGCPFCCEGCITPESHQINKGKLVRVKDLAEDILSQKQIEGISISGGEPFLQAPALTNLLDIVLRERPDMTVISFTGYLIENLTSVEAEKLIAKLDLLIDGPYVKALNDNIGLRGSSNQRFHFLTSRLLPWKEEMEQGKRKVEFHINEGWVKGYGVPSDKMIVIKKYQN